VSAFKYLHTPWPYESLHEEAYYSQTLLTRTQSSRGNRLIDHLLISTRITYSDPEGVERTWESAERLTRPKGCDIDGVGVIAILQDPSKPDESPRILLQKQWRPPVNATVIEVPAGLIDPKETPEVCAVRELKEETGYVGEVMQGGFGVSPVMFNGKLHVVHSLTRTHIPTICQIPGFVTQIYA